MGSPFWLAVLSWKFYAFPHTTCRIDPTNLMWFIFFYTWLLSWENWHSWKRNDLLEIFLISIDFCGVGRCIGTLRGHDDEVLDVAFDFTGQMLLTASADGTARCYNAVSHNLISKFEGHEGEISKVNKMVQFLIATFILSSPELKTQVNFFFASSDCPTGCTLFTFSSSPKPLDQFQPNSSLFKWKAMPFSQGDMIRAFNQPAYVIA